METRRVRLGDVIDDYCPSCRLIMNHGVVGMIEEEVKKVRCSTCLSEHVYRHGKLPARRKDRTSKLFEEVLKGMSPESSPEPVPAQEQEPAQEPPPRKSQRRLYTIRRAKGGKPPGGGSKGS